jgi:hypothetical protein
LGDPSSGKNTIHVDDLVSGHGIPSLREDGGLIRWPQGRNFALNPRQGLKISAFKDAHTPRAMADRELDDLAKYLLHVATIDDMETLNHKVGANFHQDFRRTTDLLGLETNCSCTASALNVPM